MNTVNIIRMLHFADIHVGMENYGKIDPETGTSSRVRDFLDRLDEVIDFALGAGVDLAVFAGDAFKNRDPDPTQQREFARRIKRLADVVPTLLLVGNHDVPGMSARATSLEIFSVLGVPAVIVGDRPGSQVIETRNGPVFLAWMPYPIRNRLLSKDEYRGKSINELELALQRATAEIIEDLTEKAGKHAMPRVLAGHFTVAEAKVGSERTVILGGDVAVNRSTLADPRWDYVALGHIHKHQDVNRGRRPPVVYSGSLERIDFGEENEPKGFCWVELQREATEWAFHKVQARAFKTVRVDVRGEEDPTGVVIAALGAYDLAEKVVRLQVRLDAAQVPQLRDREIGKALEMAASFNLQKEVEQVARARLSGLKAESLTPQELTEKYFQDKGYTPERIEELKSRAEGLFGEE